MNRALNTVSLALSGPESCFKRSKAQPQEVGGPERGTRFRLQEYEGVGVSLVEVFERVGNLPILSVKIKDKSAVKRAVSHPGGTRGNSRVLGCRPVLQIILTLFLTKIWDFPHPFSDLASKIHTHFQTWLLGYYVISFLD